MATHFQIVLGDEVADGQFALDEHGERGGLDAADRESSLVVGQGVGAREIHADQPIGAAAAAGGIGERIVVGAGAERVEAFADGVGSERGDPEAADGLVAMGGFVDVAEDQFALAAGVGGADYSRDARGVRIRAHGFELVLGFFVDDERPLARQHGQEVAAPVLPFGVDLVGLREGGQMADGPSDYVAVAVEVAFALLAGAENAGDIAGDGGLFGEHSYGSGFRGRHGQSPV